MNAGNARAAGGTENLVIAVIAIVLAVVGLLVQAGGFLLQLVLQARGPIDVSWISLLDIPVSVVVLALGVIAWIRGGRGRLLGAAAVGIGGAVLIPVVFGLIQDAVLRSS